MTAADMGEVFSWHGWS